ncbi:aminoglycoside phosphotransferase family protein [Devosia riboflavina]
MKMLSFETVSGGTFGLCFRTTHDGDRLFLKTHGSPAQARADLAKEIGILDHLDGEQLHIRSVTTRDDRLWLVMKELQPTTTLWPKQILALTGRNEEKLRAYPLWETIPADASLAYLVGEADHALSQLVVGDKLGRQAQEEIPAYLSLLLRSLPTMPQMLCHGDLGPRNLMMDPAGLYAIDWEDAFWGVEGYDYLYWLTFFENRRHHGAAMFGHTPWNKPVEIAILLTVLVLKCALSLRNGTHIGNTISFDQRLTEIINLA